MNWRRLPLALAAWLARRPGAPAPDPDRPRLLVLRRNRLGDMICTLPLLHALRRHYPRAHLVVACDGPGAPIARASGVVDEVVVLRSSGLLAALFNARRLQHFDLALAAKGGFDRRWATLLRLTNAPRRVGFDQNPSLYYTDPVPVPAASAEHQIETILRLLAPLNISAPSAPAPLPLLELPAPARDFAAALLVTPPLKSCPRVALLNLSSTSQLRFRAEDFIALAERLAAADPGLAVLFIAAPADQPRARDFAARCASDRVAAAATPGPLELAALMRRASFLVTPEGGAAHLAAAVQLPAVVLWSEGPFDKWRSRSDQHLFVRAEPGETFIPLDRVWPALQPFLPPST